MNIDPTLPWDTLLNRVLQSWKDSAWHQSQREWFYDEHRCEECDRDYYAAFAEAANATAGVWWPHWMFHNLHGLIIALRNELLLGLFEQPLANATVADYYRGSGLIPKAQQDAATREAIRLVADHNALFDLWLRERLSNLGAWPERVLRGAAVWLPARQPDAPRLF